MLDDLVDFLPRIRDRFVGRPGVGIFAHRFRGIGKIETVIEFHGLVPIVELRRPADAIVSRDPAESFFAIEKPVAVRARQLTSRAKRDSIVERRQLQRRPDPVRSQVEKIVVRMEESRGVIPGSRAAARPEIAVRLNAGAVTARHVIWDQVDDRFQSMRVEPFDQLLKFRQPLGRVFGVVRADVEVILDRVRTARESLQ